MKALGQDITRYQELCVEMLRPPPSECDIPRCFKLRVVATDDRGSHITEWIQRTIPLTPDDVERVFASITQASQQWVTRGVVRESLDPLKEIGKRLFTCLFEGESGQLYQQALGAMAKSQDLGLCLRLVINDPELAAIPWEVLYDVYRQVFVALTDDSSIIRGRDKVADVPQPPPIEPPLRVLVIVANRDEAESKADIDVLQRLDTEMKDLEVKCVTVDEERLIEEVRSDHYHIFHIIGHTFNSAIRQRLLGDLLTISGGIPQKLHNLRFVYMNANHSAEAAFALAGFVPGILGIGGTIRHEAEQFCTESFYRALLTGLPLEAAVRLGRRRIYFQSPESREWALPVLYAQMPEGIVMKPKPLAEQPPMAVLGPPHDASGSAVKDEHREFLQMRLDLLKGNKVIIEEQLARHGSVYAPPSLRAQLSETEAEINELQSDLDKLQ
jgi:hypothetical protein